MENGLTLLGADAATLKKNAPYIGGGVGALVGGVLTRLIFGKYAKTIVRPFGVRLRITRPVRYSLGAAVGAAAGAGIGYRVKNKG